MRKVYSFIFFIYCILRKRKKKKDKKKRNKAKLEIQRELAKNAKSLPIKNEPAPSEILSDDDDDENPYVIN